MFRLLILSVALSACVADEKPEASASPPLLHNEHLHRVEEHRLRDGLARLRSDLHRANDRLRDDRHRDHGHEEPRWWEQRGGHQRQETQGPVILRSLRPDETGHKPDIARQNKIIADVYSPDYAEPTWVLDYRYLKTGGRDYTRGPGGQIIILPKGIHTNEKKEFKNYDDLIEHLRLKNLAERKKPQYYMPLGEAGRGDDDEDFLGKYE